MKLNYFWKQNDVEGVGDIEWKYVIDCDVMLIQFECSIRWEIRPNGLLTHCLQYIAT